MSGQKPTPSDHTPRRDVHSGRSHGNARADVHRPGQPYPRASIPGDAARSGVLGSVSSAQARWPEYNRVIFAVSLGGTAAVITVAAIVRAVTG